MNAFELTDDDEANVLESSWGSFIKREIPEIDNEQVICNKRLLKRDTSIQISR